MPSWGSRSSVLTSFCGWASVDGRARKVIPRECACATKATYSCVLEWLFQDLRSTQLRFLNPRDEQSACLGLWPLLPIKGKTRRFSHEKAQLPEVPQLPRASAVSAAVTGAWHTSLQQLGKLPAPKPNHDCKQSSRRDIHFYSFLTFSQGIP